MEKIDLTKQFASRLRDALINAGFNSQRSTSGVSIHKLAEIPGHSLQICRKYLRVEVIPDPVKLIDIAKQLCVSPGWLLFGDACNATSRKDEALVISKNLLRYIFTKTKILYHNEHIEHEVTDFLIDLISDMSVINVNEAQSKKIIDLAISSTQHFSR
jgi:hypothetical protein